MFREQGHLIARGILPQATVSAILGYLEQHLETARCELRRIDIDIADPEAPEQIKALMSAPDAGETAWELRTAATGHFPLAVRLGESLWSIAKEPALRELVGTILGTGPLRMHMPPMARFVLPGNGEAGVPAHQDATYNTHMANFVTAWTPLVEIDQLCGGVTVFPGSDREQLPARRMHHGVWLEGLDTSGWQAIDCVPMSPGDILLFNPLLVHRSMANLSERIRFSIDCRFFTGASSKHYLDIDRWEIVAP